MPHDRHGDGSGGQGHAAHVERSCRVSRQGSSDDNCRACARRVERYPPTQCTCVCLRTGGFCCDAAGEQVTLTAGETFYEGPDDVHLVDRNASSTKPAKFLVFLIKNKGAPAVVPVQ